MTHELIVAASIVDTVRKVKEEVALSNELKQVSLFVLRGHVGHCRWELANNLLRLNIGNGHPVETVGLVVREGCD